MQIFYKGINPERLREHWRINAHFDDLREAREAARKQRDEDEAKLEKLQKENERLKKENENLQQKSPPGSESTTKLGDDATGPR